jgi:chromosomal replication initiation ATPase DnaA
VEEAKGKKWAEFSGLYGDWGRDAVLWLGRRGGRLSLSGLGKMVGGMDYAAVGQAVRRFGRLLEKEAALRRKVAEMKSQL